MKKLASSFILLFLALSLVSLLSLRVVNAEPQTIVVPDDYSTIDDAIGKASDGDKIFVKKGTYDYPINQTLVINKTISLIGEDAESTTINFHPPWVLKGWEIVSPVYGYDDPIKFFANGVQFSGFTITTIGGFLFLDVRGNGTQITGNNLKTSLYLEKSNQNITANNIHGNILCTGHNHTVAHNILGGNIWSIAVGVLIDGNTISDEDWGIGLGGYGNTVFNNTIENCNTSLAFWGASSNNLICSNNFINNTVPAQFNTDNPSVGDWDNGYAMGGNYWSDYNGTDDNGDGIGDSPYIIDNNNQDNFPLTEPVNETIIPEFPLWIVFPLLSTITLIVIAYKKKLPKQQTEQSY